MLFGKDCRRSEKGCLLPAHYRLKCRPHRNFCFPIADIAADEPIHWNWFFHISLYVTDTGELILGFLIGKGCFKGGLPLVIFGKGKTGRSFPAGI